MIEINQWYSKRDYITPGWSGSLGFCFYSDELYGSFLVEPCFLSTSEWDRTFYSPHFPTARLLFKSLNYPDILTKQFGCWTTMALDNLKKVDHIKL